jgi:hypothetical protein
MWNNTHFLCSSRLKLQTWHSTFYNALQTQHSLTIMSIVLFSCWFWGLGGGQSSMVLHVQGSNSKSWAIYLFLFLTQEKTKGGGDLRWIKQFFFPNFCDIKKIGHVIPPKISKINGLYTKETENSKNFPIFFRIKKVKNWLEKTIVKEGPCWKGGIFWFKLMNWNFRTK